MSKQLSGSEIENEELKRRTRLLNSLIWLLMGTLGLFLVYVLALGLRSVTSALISFAAALLVSGIGYWLARSGRFYSAVYLFLAGFVILLILLILLGGSTAFIVSGEPRLGWGVMATAIMISFVLACMSWLFGESINNAFSALRQRSEELRVSQEKIRQLNKELEQRVVERTRQLEAANKELEAFAYSVSHDLRAPLRSIDGFSQVMLEDYADKLDAEGRDYLQRLCAASQRMAMLIDDMLKLSRMTCSSMQYKTVNLSQLAESIAAELQQSQPEREVEFIIAAGLTANGDKRLLEVALENLLENAWKFTEKHAHAKIEFGSAEADGKRAYFVRDDGVGFDMAYVDKLFRPFQRLHSVTEFEGTGIGLATVQRIIHRHGGQVWGEGAVEGGATFYFTLN